MVATYIVLTIIELKTSVSSPHTYVFCRCPVFFYLFTGNCCCCISDIDGRHEYLSLDTIQL